jgi:glycosyltransferase involved in cell wall biosynthesis
LHAGVPIIATRRGGIPLQVVHERDGFLVHRDIKDEKTGHFVARDRQDFAREVAQHLKVLFTNADQYDFFAEYARTHVSDEVSTVGNALCWLYLADTLAKGKSVVPERKWIHDMAREQAKNEGVVFDSTPEEKLPRTDTLQPSQ